jgi:hypothetical protein
MPIGIYFMLKDLNRASVSGLLARDAFAAGRQNWIQPTRSTHESHCPLSSLRFKERGENIRFLDIRRAVYYQQLNELPMLASVESHSLRQTRYVQFDRVNATVWFAQSNRHIVHSPRPGPFGMWSKRCRETPADCQNDQTQGSCQKIDIRESCVDCTHELCSYSIRQDGAARRINQRSNRVVVEEGVVTNSKCKHCAGRRRTHRLAEEAHEHQC